MQKDTNFLENMTRNDFILFRKYVIHGILHTDMAEHSSLINQISFKQTKEEDFIPDEEEYPEEFLDLFALMIHTADLYVPSKSPNISRVWTDRVNSEFIAQYKHEK